MYIHLLILLMGLLGLTSIVVVHAGLKMIKQLRDREEHLDEGSVVILYSYFLGLGLSVALGLFSSMILSGALLITSFVVAPAGLKVLKQLRDRKDRLDEGSIVILCTYFISLGLTIALHVFECP